MHLVPNDQTLFMRAENHGLITGSQHYRIVWAVHTLMADFFEQVSREAPYLNFFSFSLINGTKVYSYI